MRILSFLSFVNNGRNPSLTLSSLNFFDTFCEIKAPGINELQQYMVDSKIKFMLGRV
jgi:hypothetical protein